MIKGIKNGRIYYRGAFIEDHVLLYNSLICGIVECGSSSLRDDCEWIDAKGAYVLPGFIDIHIHGYLGCDVMSGQGRDILTIAEGIRKNGVTSFLPTTMTMPLEQIGVAIESVIEVMEKSPNHKGARILGLHLEGPFINGDFKGAQGQEAIVSPSSEKAMAFVEKYKEHISVMTIAPEVDGALDMIKLFKDDIRFSLGHSAATYEEACEAIGCGATSVTHLYNAMTGLHHRKPGLVGAAFNQNIYSELIADNIHVSSDLYEFSVKNIGLERLLLITDCMEGGGLGDGFYNLGGHKVHVEKGICTLEDGTIAGSVLSLVKALKNIHAHMIYELEELIDAVTLNQAQYLGVDDQIGSLDMGKRADIVLLDEKLTVLRTIIEGECVYDLESSS